MPLQIRLFFWLSVVVVACWAIRTASFWLQAVPYLGSLSEYYVHTAVEATILLTIPWCVATFCLAWMAAFRHSNPARWSFVALFLFREIVLFAIAMRSLGAGPYGYNYFVHHWTAPSQFLTTLPLLAASILVFTGNGKAWFEMPAKSLAGSS